MAGYSQMDCGDVFPQTPNTFRKAKPTVHPDSLPQTGLKRQEKQIAIRDLEDLVEE